MRRVLLKIGQYAGIAFLAFGCGPGESPSTSNTPPQPPAQAGKSDLEVKLCDGETTTRVPAQTARTREDGMKIADSLMAQWKRKHPESNWVEQEREKHMIVPPHDNRSLIGMGQGQTYAKITEVDVAT